MAGPPELSERTNIWMHLRVLRATSTSYFLSRHDEVADTDRGSNHASLEPEPGPSLGDATEFEETEPHRNTPDREESTIARTARRFDHIGNETQREWSSATSNWATPRLSKPNAMSWSPLVNCADGPSTL